MHQWLLKRQKQLPILAVHCTQNLYTENVQKKNYTSTTNWLNLLLQCSYLSFFLHHDRVMVFYESRKNKTINAHLEILETMNPLSIGVYCTYRFNYIYRWYFYYLFETQYAATHISNRHTSMLSGFTAWKRFLVMLYLHIGVYTFLRWMCIV